MCAGHNWVHMQLKHLCPTAKQVVHNAALLHVSFNGTKQWVSGTFVPTYFPSQEQKFHRWNFLHPGTFARWNFVPGIKNVMELLLPQSKKIAVRVNTI